MSLGINFERSIRTDQCTMYIIYETLELKFERQTTIECMRSIIGSMKQLKYWTQRQNRYSFVVVPSLVNCMCYFVFVGPSAIFPSHTHTHTHTYICCSAVNMILYHAFRPIHIIYRHTCICAPCLNSELRPINLECFGHRCYDIYEKDIQKHKRIVRYF